MKTATVGIYETAGWKAADQFQILVSTDQPLEYVNGVKTVVLEGEGGMTKASALAAIAKVHITHKDWFLDRGITTLKIDTSAWGGWMYELKEIKEFCPVEDT